MAYDAVAVSSDDLLAGTDFFREATAKGFPFIAANIYDQEENLTFFPAYNKKYWPPHPGHYWFNR